MCSDISEGPPGSVLIGGIEKRKIILAPYDPGWPVVFASHRSKIANALADSALRIEHIGSTSVPGLAAKPIVDMIVVVADASDESGYLHRMETAGYVLRVREPDWHEHRMFRTSELDVHIHFYSQGSVEIDRSLAFRDHLRSSCEDRKLYENVKQKLARNDWSNMNAYADAKSDVIRDILARALGA